jgi:hypothetical protein
VLFSPSAFARKKIMTDAFFISEPDSPSMLRCLNALEARYDGAIPEIELRALRFGSARAAEIAETRAEITFFRTMARHARISGKAWLARGNRRMAAATLAEAKAYLFAWRKCRHKLAELLHEMKVREARVDIARQQTLAMVGTHIIAPLTGAEIAIPPIGKQIVVPPVGGRQESRQ